MNDSITFPMHFIRASSEYCTLGNHVQAPFFRKTFALEKKAENASLLICGLGFYEVWLNGQRLTKGALAPYISSPDDILYYDEYEAMSFLKTGENVLAVCLGNGLQNGLGASVWDFDKARWRNLPQAALRLDITADDGDKISVESDESVDL